MVRWGIPLPGRTIRRLDQDASPQRSTDFFPVRSARGRRTPVLRYFVNLYPEGNGDHLVHREGCTRMPTFPLNLGHHATCREAVDVAKRFFPRSNGCFQCARECHLHRPA